jgi:hypothetical protein
MKEAITLLGVGDVLIDREGAGYYLSACSRVLRSGILLSLTVSRCILTR